MLVGTVLVRFFRFSTPLLFLLLNHVVFLLSVSQSINCAASSERTIGIIVCMFFGSFFFFFFFLRTGVI